MEAHRFHELNDAQLDDLSDEDLIAYIRHGRAAGRHDAVTTGLRVMVFGHYGNVERRVRMKVPVEAIDEVTGEIIIRAMKSAFDGESVGQFVSWLKVITSRVIAEYWRKGDKAQGGVERPDALPDRDASDQAGGRGVAPEPRSEGGYAAVDTQAVVDDLLAGLGSDKHRRGVELYLLDGWSAAEAGRKVGDELGEELSEQNVHQIASRFRRELRDQLGGAG
ncbi:MAG: RNA polymerase sigma factor [Thermoleophilaceae bacterium]